MLYLNPLKLFGLHSELFGRAPLACLLATFTLLGCGQSSGPQQQPPTSQAAPLSPNVIILYVDDLGYADIGSYGAIGVQTPQIDRLSNDGIRFTDMHSSAATCTPSRYSLLTGRHGFRNDAAILPGDAPLLIAAGSDTLPSMFQRAGYTTAVVGKWHLGLGAGDVNWNAEISPGPLEIGFDYAFLVPATGDRVPTVYVENHHIVGLDPQDPIEVSYKHRVGERPSGWENPELLRVKADRQHSDTIINGVSRIGYMGGGESALWVDEEFPDVLTSKAVDFIRQNKDTPFFLYYSFHDIHVPRLPNPRFEGASSMGPRGDAIAQVDWVTGEIMGELEKLGIAENTIVIFTSDNGPVLDDGYADRAVEDLGDHRPGGPYRGGKYSAYEAGTRVPGIVYWPGHVKPATADALVSQMDIYASFAAMLDVSMAPGEAFDSLNMLDTWLGQEPTGRDYLIEESVGTMSLRYRNWKYIAPFPEGRALPDWLPAKGIEGGFNRHAQLFDLSSDEGEQVNLAESNKELVDRLQSKLDEIISTGYGTGD